MSTPVLKFDPSLSKPLVQEVMERSGQNILSCYQCRRCAAGCPVGDETGVTPDRLIRMILLGERDDALQNLLVWKCVACYTCGTRCPNNIQTARITETLKQMSKEAHLEPLTPRVAFFHKAFMASTASGGRVNELQFMRMYEMETLKADFKQGGLKAVMDELRSQAGLGLAMWKKNRMHFGGEKIKHLAEVKRLYQESQKKSGSR